MDRWIATFATSFSQPRIRLLAGGSVSSSPRHHFSPCACHLTPQPEAGLWKRLFAGSGMSTEPSAPLWCPPWGRGTGTDPAEPHSWVFMPRTLLDFHAKEGDAEALEANTTSARQTKTRSHRHSKNKLQPGGFCKVRKTTTKKAPLCRNNLLNFFKKMDFTEMLPGSIPASLPVQRDPGMVGKTRWVSQGTTATGRAQLAGRRAQNKPPALRGGKCWFQRCFLGTIPRGDTAGHHPSAAQGPQPL